jgi:hypothetical protein
MADQLTDEEQLLSLYAEGAVDTTEENEVDETEEEAAAREALENKKPENNNEGDDDNEGDDADDDEGAYEEEVKLFREGLGLEENEEVDFTATGLLKIFKDRLSKTEEKYKQYEEPKIQKIVSHLIEGGTLESFLNVPEPYNLENYPNDTDEDKETNIARLYSELKGLSKEEYEPILANIKNTEGGLEKVSAVALKALEDRDTKVHSEYEKTVASEKETENLELEEARKEAEEAWNEVNTNIKESKIGEYSIPKADVKGFTEYINSINTTGRREDLTTLDMMRFDYLRFKKWNVEDSKNSIFNAKPKRNGTSLISKSRGKGTSDVVSSEEEAYQILASLGK